jgi:alpha-L-arabinofuranosidase
LGKKIKRKQTIKMMIRKTTLFFAVILISLSGMYAQSTQTLQVVTDKPGSVIQPTMWGIFFEDINFAADGGIYAELVKNRSFEFLQPLMGWKEHQSDRFSLQSNSGKAMILNRGDNVSNPRFARLGIIADKGYGMSNEGFRGMGFKKDNTYSFTMLGRQMDGKTSIRVELIDSKGSVLGSATVSPEGKEWKKYTATITSSATDPKGSLNIWFDGKGILDIDMVSLFPTDTWKNRPGGMRKDLVQLLADLKPGFIRFPGGCIVEGRDLSQRYQWKKTVGNVDDRELLINRWNTEFNHRPAPDYFQSFGLGFYEYFLLAEDIGAEPLPVLSCGLACQFNSAEVVPMDQLEPYIQDALDLIEFANGEVTTKWGKLRADMGHAAPFNMKFIGVGNEQWGPQYIERYKVFEKAIKEKYPKMTIVSGTGPFPEGELFDFAAQQLKELKAEIVDEHYYAKPEWFFQNVTRYDKYDRNGPKIFAGEYAAQSVAIASPDNKNNWQCALSEAAFMTGLERNADVVHLCSYAPLFAHSEGWQWTPDLIWFDNIQSYATPNYYVQKLYSNNKGTHVLNVTNGKENVTGQNDLYASAVWDKNSKEVILKIVNNSSTEKSTQLNLAGSKKYSGDAKVISLTASAAGETNSFEKPENIKPVESSAKISGKKVNLSLKPYSLTVVKLTTR